MRFSEAFGITKGRGDDWFDPHLSVDTRLFVDPLLIFLTQKPGWTDAHDELISHFVHCYKLVAQATGPHSTSAKAAHRLLTFPEPGEFCLGFTASGTRGSGTGSQFAGRMADGIAVALAAGLDNPEHIEEIGILNVGIGADRISDAVCNVLKRRLIAYTQILMWNGSFGDSTVISPQQLIGLAEQYLTPGTIMLGHLNHPTILSLFGQIQSIINDRNLQPVTLDEMFGTSRATG